jgi:hypothetical protein
MIWRIRIALLTSVVMASALCMVRAADTLADDKKEPIAPPATAPAPAPAPTPMIGGGCGSPCGAPTYKTVCVTEWVPEYYKTTRTVYKKECVAEKYTAYKTECVPEIRTRNDTHYERICETHDVTKTICEKVCVQEARTVCKTHWTCVPETTFVCKTVDKGHYECKEVPCSEGFFSKHRSGGLFSHKHSDCCDPCASACGCDACTTCCAPPTKTVKVWVSCKVTEQVPCTKMVKKCETIQVQETVNVWKSIPKTIVVKETCWKCVPVCKTETYTVNVSHCVPYEATRMVSRCVPVTEEVTACKMVARTVTKQVACDTCSTCSSCGTTCGCEKEKLCDRLHGLFARRHHECGCEATCGSTCGGGCSTCGH